ncbi:tail completion or Neck1 protein [Vibrio phage phi 3]|uniref:Tail completion protein n=1 Tax=Vibrio phage phi 3 TaxID=1589298 RepID=A0A0B5H918_9CAUD|nr:tail completion or Neck1 protein [Vibrio phage phi 3]AJF40903.1 hypothetical protein SBVP3_00136 [Vibrio phage phi 3]
MVSKMFKDIVSEALSDDKLGVANNRVKYTITTKDSRVDSTVATVTMDLKNPVPESVLSGKVRRMLAPLAESLMAENLGVIDQILEEMGIPRSRVGRKQTTGDVTISLGDSVESLEESKVLKVGPGTRIGIGNLRGTLELLAKNYLIKQMKKENAPLKFRTGRFANSLQVTSMTEEADDIPRANKRSKPRLSIFYTYMTYPYATFDPLVSTRPEMHSRPWPGARNPQVHIGEAIAKAARDLFYNGYRVEVKQRK